MEVVIFSEWRNYVEWIFKAITLSRSRVIGFICDFILALEIKKKTFLSVFFFPISVCVIRFTAVSVRWLLIFDWWWKLVQLVVSSYSMMEVLSSSARCMESGRQPCPSV